MPGSTDSRGVCPFGRPVLTKRFEEETGRVCRRMLRSWYLGSAGLRGVGIIEYTSVYNSVARVPVATVAKRWR